MKAWEHANHNIWRNSYTMYKICSRFGFLLFTLILLMMFSSCGGATKTSITTDTLSNLEEELISQIDWTLDDYLESIDADQGAKNDLITLRSLTPGHFSSNTSDELLALFCVDAVHGAGLDRTIAAIYDRTSLKIMTQHSFISDKVSLYILPGSSQGDSFLYIGCTTNQGESSYYIDRLELQGKEWVSIPIDDVQNQDQSQNYCYTFASGAEDAYITVFTLSYPDFPMKEPELNYKYSLYWDQFSQTFLKIK